MGQEQNRGAEPGESMAAGEILERLDPSNADLAPVVKAYFVGNEDGGDKSNAIVQQELQSTAFKDADIVPPLYDPNMLAMVFENSSTLRQCVDAYVINCDSYGHKIEPVIDLKSSGADELIRDAMRMEREKTKRAGIAAASKNKDTKALAEAMAPVPEPSDEEVAERKKQLEIDIRRERAMLEIFFANCSTDIPFSGPEGLRGLLRQDIEIMGQGFWEVLRNGLGEVRRFNHLPSRTMRFRKVDDTPVAVEIPRRTSLLSQETETVEKKFRSLAQVQDGTNKIVYFKEFDDPRVMDSETGKFYEDKAAAEKARTEGGNTTPFRPATEVLSFKITSTRSVYGCPRWIGALLAVMGNRNAEEVNFLYFENRSVPPLAILVSGGRLNADTVNKLQDYIRDNIKGKRNSHKIMILEGEPATGGDGSSVGKMKIELRPLTDAQQKDSLFQGYDERNADKIGQIFRLPKMLRGDVQDQNRSTADASVAFAEVQVFNPIRTDFDWRINSTVLPEIGAKYHKIVSNGPVVKDPEQLSAMIVEQVTANVLTPGEGRQIAADVFHRSFDERDEEWTKQPIGLTVAGRNMSGDSGEGGSPGVGGGVMSQPGAGPTQAALQVDQTKERRDKRVAQSLMRMHKSMVKREAEDFETETIRVPVDLFLSFFTPSSEK